MIIWKRTSTNLQFNKLSKTFNILINNNIILFEVLKKKPES